MAAGVKQQLERDLPNFQVIACCRALHGDSTGMGLPKSRGEMAAAFLTDFVEAKRQRLCRQGTQRHGINGATVAPLR